MLLALVQFYKYLAPQGRLLRGKTLETRREGRELVGQWYPVQLQQVVRKLAVFHPDGFMEEGVTMWFMKFYGSGFGWQVNGTAVEGARLGVT